MMKLHKIRIFIFIISLFLLMPLCANQAASENLKGVALCNQIFKLLQTSSYLPEKEQLISQGKNNFPYNIILNFNSTINSEKKLIYVFNQEEIIQKQDLILSFCQACSQCNYPVTILFSYGQKQPLQYENSVNGTNVFINENISSAGSVIALIIELSGSKNILISASSGKTSPSWVITHLYNLILKLKMNFRLPPYYLSQLYTFNFSKDSDLDLFFNAGIPCVKLSLENNQNQETAVEFLNSIVALFQEDFPLNFDQHFLILNLFGQKYVRLNEQFIVICVIIIVFIFLIFLFLLFFIDSRRRRNAFISLKHNWHPLVFTYIIVIAAFLLGKGGFLIHQKTINSVSGIFILYIVQVLFSVSCCFGFYIFEYINNKKIDADAVDYTVVLATFLNQFIFLYVDISLFPIFSLICILSVISLYIEKPALHIPIFVLMLLPFVIYAYLLLSNAQITELKLFLLNSESTMFFLSFVICPLYLKLDRVFISYAKKAKSRKSLVISTTSILLVFCILVALISVCCIILSNKYENKPLQNVIRTQRDESIKIEWSDSSVFDDKIRTISVKIPEDSISCDVRISSKELTPVLYSDNSYSVIDQNTAVFLIPPDPPEALQFSYGTSAQNSTVSVTVICRDSAQNQFIMHQKTVKISS